MADRIDYYKDLEKRILNIVEKITNNRNRPCYQNVHTFLTRGDFIIDDREFKIFIDDLLEKGILINIGTVEKESFRLGSPPIVEDSEPGKDENKNNDEIFINTENLSTNEKSSVNDFNNYKFYETLVERIKCEVIKCVESKLGDYGISNIPRVINDPVEVNQCNGDDLHDGLILNQLNSEVERLRTELKSKDKIIEMLTKGNDNKNASDIIKSNIIKQKDINENKQFNKRVVRNGERGDISVTLNLHETETFDDANFTEVTSKSKTKKDTRTITILGDSIVKEIKVHKMKRKLARNEKLYVKSFSGATVADMVDYSRPTVRKEPDLIVLHAGTNDLRSNKTAENIASDIIKLALELKSEKNDVMISSLVFRDDTAELNDKGKAVNLILKAECECYNLLFIDHSNIQKQHLNGSKLHLNYKGTIALANNFLNHIKI